MSWPNASPSPVRARAVRSAVTPPPAHHLFLRFQHRSPGIDPARTANWAGCHLSARDLPHRHAIAGTGPAGLEDLIMATFLFAYRRPENYTPGRPAAIAAWSAWFESIGANVAERGNPV